MNDRFKFNAIVSSYYDIYTPENYEEFEPQFYLKNVDLFSDEIGIDYERLLDAVQKQLNLEKPEISQVMQHFEDNSNAISEEYVTIKPDKILQSTGKKDANGKLIFEDDIVELKAKNGMIFQYVVKFKDYCFILEYINGKLKGTKARNFAKQYAQPQIMYEHGYIVIGNIYENKELLNENS